MMIVPNILSDVVANLDDKVKLGLLTFFGIGLILWINSRSKPKVPWHRD